MSNARLHEAILQGTVDSVIHPDHTALLVVDAQNDFLHPDGVLAKRQDPTYVQAAIPRMNEAIEEARHCGVRVVYLSEVISRATLLPNVISLSSSRGDSAAREGTWGAEFFEGLLQPAEKDMIIQKSSYDGFEHTSLDVRLRALGIRTCVYCGGATNGVESTARHGFVAGYYTAFLYDACGAASANEQWATMETFRRRLGPVLSVADASKAWRAAVAATEVR
jgi:nicotinamidase-related amidase